MLMLDAKHFVCLAVTMDVKDAGRRGGERRAKALTPKQRKDIARKAALARWRKRGKK
jgi:hypothetical protein